MHQFRLSVSKPFKVIIAMTLRYRNASVKDGLEDGLPVVLLVDFCAVNEVGSRV